MRHPQGTNGDRCWRDVADVVVMTVPQTAEFDGAISDARRDGQVVTFADVKVEDVRGADSANERRQEIAQVAIEGKMRVTSSLRQRNVYEVEDE